MPPPIASIVYLTNQLSRITPEALTEIRQASMSLASLVASMEAIHGLPDPSPVLSGNTIELIPKAQLIGDRTGRVVAQIRILETHTAKLKTAGDPFKGLLKELNELISEAENMIKCH